MAGSKKFEEIQAWQKARKATKRVSTITSAGKFANDFGSRDQIRRASVSVMANIAEGQGRYSNKECAKFLKIAFGSLAETRSHSDVALDLEYPDQADFIGLL